jgi:hypothetical protein
MSDVNDYTIPASAPAPGTIPSYVNPPRAPEGAVMEAAANPAPAAEGETKQASNGPNIFSSLARKVGWGHKEQPAAPQAAPAPKHVPAPKARAIAKNVAPPRAPEQRMPEPRIIPLNRTAQATPENKPSDPVPPASVGASPQQTIAGAQPTAPANSFDSRWSSFR